MVVGLKPGNEDKLIVSLRRLSWFKMQTAFKVLEMAHPGKIKHSTGGKAFSKLLWLSG